jgi:hypothetical protein
MTFRVVTSPGDRRLALATARSATTTLRAEGCGSRTVYSMYTPFGSQGRLQSTLMRRSPVIRRPLCSTQTVTMRLTGTSNSS